MNESKQSEEKEIKESNKRKWESEAGWQESVRMQSKKEESEEYGGKVRECRARRRTKFWEESKLGK